MRAKIKKHAVVIRRESGEIDPEEVEEHRILEKLGVVAVYHERVQGGDAGG